MSAHSVISTPSPTVSPAAVHNVMPLHESSQNEQEILPMKEVIIQFKLAVGSPDDPLEHEADAMADNVMRMPDQNFIRRKCSCEEDEKIQRKPVDAFIQKQHRHGSVMQMPGQHFIQRKCHQCKEEEEKVQRKPLASFIQRKETTADAILSNAVNNQINASKGSGSNMDSSTQSFMQNRFGADFTDVKIHTGGEAIQMNRELNAKAFTVGSDIYFNEGQYDPRSNDGKFLLAHELTHTIQQNSATTGAATIQRKPDTNDETKKHTGIDYNAAIQQNQHNWDTRDKFYSIFNEVKYGTGEGIFPGTTPVAYTNHVYELQQLLKVLWKDKYIGQLNGIVDMQLLSDIQVVATNYDEKKKTAVSAFGIDTIILERFLRIKRNITRNKALASGLARYDIFNNINDNYLFGIALNDKGEYIGFLQSALFDMNYLVRDDINNAYDQKTYGAIRQFQHDTGLKVDGIIGPDTLQLLDNFLLGKTSAFITPGSSFRAWGRLSDVITIYTDGDGDQKKELKIEFTKKGNSVIAYVLHIDTNEKKGPLSFSFPGLDLNSSMWIFERERSNGIKPTVIGLQPPAQKTTTDATPQQDYLITITPPDAANPGLYHFNDQAAQFNANKFEPEGGFASAPDSEQVNTTNPTYLLDVGPYNDSIKLFFKTATDTATLKNATTDGRAYAADLYLVGIGDKNIAYGGIPLNVKLKYGYLGIKTVRHNLDVISFDLDGDGVEDITLHYRITQAQQEQRPDFDRYIELFFDGPALDAQKKYTLEKIGGYFVGTDRKSEELFKQLVPATGNEQLEQQEIPESRQQDIAILSNLLSQIYIKALDEDLIKGDTYLAWKKLDISLQYLKLFVIGKATLSDDDNKKIMQTAGFANEYLEKIRRDTVGKEDTGSYSLVMGEASSTTTYKENPYTGDSESTTSGGMSTRTDTVVMNLGTEIMMRQWADVSRSYETLAKGFNLWVANRLGEKHKDDPTLAAQTKGAFLFIKELQSIINDKDVIHLTRVKAVYYSYEKYLKEKGLPVIELPLYYYYNTASRKWWIVDFINPAAPYKDHVELGSGETPGDKPPAELFKKLNDKDHLPKGMLLYATPDKSITGQVELTEPWEWKDILAWFAAAVGIAALVGAMIFSGGAATPLAIQVMFAVSAIAGGAAASMDLYEHYKNEDLTPMTAMLDVGNIAASIVGLSSMASGRIIYLASEASIKNTPWVGTWAKLALAADKAYVPLAGLNLGINGFNIALLTADTITKLDDIERSAGDQASKDRAKILLLAQLAFAGGMTILSLKGDIASLSRGTNIVIFPGKNGIPVAASAAEGIRALPTEELNLRAQDEFDQVLAIREKMFGKAAVTEISKLQDNKPFMAEYMKLNKEVFDILNNPTLDVATKKQMLGEKIEAYDKLIGGQKILNKALLDTTQVKEMAAAMEEGNFGMRMTLQNGTVKMQGVELGKFPELVERVKFTNESMKTNGSDKELVIILMPSVTGDGLQEIMLLARKRWTIPSGAKSGVQLGDIGKANTTHKQYIIDVGGGTNSFAVDMIPAADIKGSTILNTEYAPTFMEPAMTRSDLTWKNAAAKTDANTVVVIGDPLVNMHEMVGDKSVRQVFINNVNAHYNEGQYKELAEQLVQSMDNGGRLQLQWTDEKEFNIKLNKEIPRGHIEGVPLEKALQDAAKASGREFTVLKDQKPVDYNYGITPSKDASITPDKPLTDAQRKGVTDPVPKYRWDFIFN